MVLNQARSAPGWAAVVASALGLLAEALAHVAWGAAIPDSARMSALRSAFERADRVRVQGRRARYELSRPRVDSAGIVLRRAPHRAALIEIGDVRAPDEKLSWEQIERIDTGRTHFARRTAVGLLVGAGAASLLVAQNGGDLDAFEQGDHGMLLFGGLFVLTGAAVGAIAGLAPEWSSVYP